jgi:hypothetical protein
VYAVPFSSPLPCSLYFNFSTAQPPRASIKQTAQADDLLILLIYNNKKLPQALPAEAVIFTVYLTTRTGTLALRTT